MQMTPSTSPEAPSMGAMFTETRASPPSRRRSRVSKPSTRSPAKLRGTPPPRAAGPPADAKGLAPERLGGGAPVSFTSAAFQTITARSRSTAQTSALACSMEVVEVGPDEGELLDRPDVADAERGVARELEEQRRIALGVALAAAAVLEPHHAEQRAGDGERDGERVHAAVEERLVAVDQQHPAGGERGGGEPGLGHRVAAERQPAAHAGAEPPLRVEGGEGERARVDQPDREGAPGEERLERPRQGGADSGPRRAPRRGFARERQQGAVGLALSRRRGGGRAGRRGGPRRLRLPDRAPPRDARHRSLPQGARTLARCAGGSHNARRGARRAPPPSPRAPARTSPSPAPGSRRTRGGREPAPFEARDLHADRPVGRLHLDDGARPRPCRGQTPYGTVRVKVASLEGASSAPTRTTTTAWRGRRRGACRCAR